MQANGQNRKCDPECGNTDTKGHAWYVLTCKWILAIMYRITMLYSIDPKKQNYKEDPREDTWISEGDIE